MQATYTGATRVLTAADPLPLDEDSRARLRARLAEGAECR
jgi:hypothetical protein